MAEQLYTQVELQYEVGSEVCWIKSELAKENTWINVGDKKTDMRRAFISKVYPETKLSAAYIGLNRQYPLRETTDI
ncbi:MAG TPA: hypothetical protein VK141_05175 [Nitrosomonas sp.]|nr:hypothetical protein [Nitrosomonas sp.]